MTISILKLSPGQKIARPFNRSSSVDEMCEMLGHQIAYAAAAAAGQKFAACQRIAAEKADIFGADVMVENLDTEEPVYRMADGSLFFAFIEG